MLGNTGVRIDCVRPPSTVENPVHLFMFMVTGGGDHTCGFEPSEDRMRDFYLQSNNVDGRSRWWCQLMPTVIRVYRRISVTGLIMLLPLVLKDSACLQLNVFLFSVCLGQEHCTGAGHAGWFWGSSSGLLRAEQLILRKALGLRVSRQFCWRAA